MLDAASKEVDDLVKDQRSEFDLQSLREQATKLQQELFASESKVLGLLSRINILEKENVDLRSQIIGWKRAVCQQEEETLEKDKQIMR